MAGLSDIELASIIKAYRDDSLGVDDGELSNERAVAFDHYHGRPYGDEQVGRSQVVSKDLSETVDWVMPQLMRVLTQSGNIVEFDPVSEDDEELAKQQSDYVNHVLMKDNNGFLLLHDAIKDALILKNGYVKHWWDETEVVKEMEYEGLTEDQLLQLFMELAYDGSEVEVKEQEETVANVDGMPVRTFGVKLEVKCKVNRVKVMAVPVEEVKISRDCTGSIQDAYYVEHSTKKTRSSLIDMGMDEDFVDKLPAINEDEHDNITYARDSVADESDSEVGLSYDRSMDEIEYNEAYILVDYDGDGRAERRKVVTVGDNKIPPGDEWNEVIDCVPMTDFVVKRIPHRHIGESLDDELSELQRIKTVLTRQLLDNVYLTNNQQWLVNNRVHLPDFLKSLPGGIKRVMDDLPVDGCAVPIQTTPILQQILPAIDYIDTVKQNRTGVNDSNSGLDPDVLRETTKGAYLAAMTKANQKIEMMARLLVETGVKSLVLRVHELLIKHQDIPRIVKLRGKFIEVKPTEWKERRDVTAKVGIGLGSEEEKQQKLAILAQAQEKIAQMGLVAPQHAYASFTDLAEALGFASPERYAFDPTSQEFQQHMSQMSQQQQSNPLAEVEQIKGQYTIQVAQMRAEMDAQAKLMKAQADMQMAQMKESHKIEMDALKMSLDAQQKEADRQSREAIEAAKLEVQAFIEGMKIDLGQPGMGAGLNEQV